MAAEDAKSDDKKGSKPKGMLIPIIASAVVSALLAGGVAFFVSSRSKAPAPVAEGEAAAEGEGGDKAEEKASEKGEHKGGKEGKDGKGKATATYLSLAPPFIINLGDADSTHFLQIEMEALVKNESIGESVKEHMPRLRNAVLMLLSQQKIADVLTREGKEALQKQELEDLQKILTEQTGKPCIEALYFTSFVVQ